MKTLLSVLVGLALVLGPVSSTRAQETKKQEKKNKKQKGKGGSDEPLPEPKDAEKQLNRTVRELQSALESGSPRTFLSYFDSAKFDDYPRFEDMVERLMREDTLRAYFRTAFTAPPSGKGKAQVSLDAEMELGRKDGVGQLTRRKQQLVIDFEYTRRGWKIINITPRDYFAPL